MSIFLWFHLSILFSDASKDLLELFPLLFVFICSFMLISLCQALSRTHECILVLFLIPAPPYGSSLSRISRFFFFVSFFYHCYSSPTLPYIVWNELITSIPFPFEDLLCVNSNCPSTFWISLPWARVAISSSLHFWTYWFCLFPFIFLAICLA